jgi:glycosyltransferase involved in cell wall biosynthesis
MTPSLTVAIVTRNRAWSLERLLTSLEPQRTQSVEVLISDDSDSRDAANTRELARAFGCRYMPGPRRGLYANRNASALEAQTTHVRTMDDDHELPPGHVDACLAAIEQDPEAIWTLSELRPDDPNGDGRGEVPGQLNARGFGEPPARGGACWAIADGATIYPRSIFTTGHLFVDDFAYGAAYLEFGSRLHSAGFRIRHLEETYVIHHVATRLTLDLRSDLASRFFAIFAHALVHQPTARNRVLMTAEIGKQLVIHPIVAPGALRWGNSVYRRRTPVLRGPVRAPDNGNQADEQQVAHAGPSPEARPLRRGDGS